ncbi:MAG: HAMP domain-containing protein [Desulfobacter sp.]|nr:MAG: HAMP domain-containing protein [Desulfobacter sp.]
MVNRIIPPKGIKTSIRSNFFFYYFVFGLIPLVTLGFFSYKTASDALKNQAREQLGHLAEKTAHQVDAFFENIEKDIIMYSDCLFIRQFFSKHTPKKPSGAIERYLKGHSHCRQILFLDSTGRQIMGVPDKAEPWNPSRFAAAWDRDLYFSEILHKDGEAFLLLSKKVYDFKTPNRAVGLLVFEIRASALTAFVSSLKMGTRGYGFMMNNQGHIIYHPDSTLQCADNVEILGDKAFSKLLFRMKSGQRGVGPYRFRNKDKFLVFAPCSRQPWSVGIALRQNEFMTEITCLRNKVITFGSLLVLLVSLVIMTFVKSFTLPIQKLTSRARAIGRGDLDQVILISSPTELQCLAMEFNNMAARLKKSMNETIALKTFNDDILQSVSSGIITIDCSGSLTSINRSAKNILGILPDMVDPGKTTKFLPPGLTKVTRLLNHTLEKGEPLTQDESEYPIAQGDPVFLEITRAFKILCQLNES